MQNERIDAGRSFDWGKASADYAKYRDIYPPRFYQELLNLGFCKKGDRVLDLGTGTGVLPRNLYHTGAHFVGTDVSENQIREAKRLSAGMDIDYVASAAEDLSFADESFDGMTACQCFFYFDPAAVLPNIARMLKPGGRFAFWIWGGCLMRTWWPAKARRWCCSITPTGTEAGRPGTPLCCQRRPSGISLWKTQRYST